MIKNITDNTNEDFIEFLRGKSATFLLALSNTKTANIDGITQAGIPGLIHLTPTLDSEFLATGKVKSLENIAETPKGVPTPALITRAVHLLKPFDNLEFINLGLEVNPQLDYFKIHDFSIKPSDSIARDAKIEANELFQKGIHFGQKYVSKSEYIILGESVPSGTTTAQAIGQALGYDCEDFFSSSFKDTPNNIKSETIKDALAYIGEDDDIFTILGKVADNMLIFNAGFILGLNNKSKIILAGGTQMAAVLLIVNSILRVMGGVIETSNLSLCTTSWVVEDEKSDIKKLLEMLDFPVNSFYSDFDFSLSDHPALKLYDEGEAKEGVGAGAALVYASMNGLSHKQIRLKVEELLGA